MYTFDKSTTIIGMLEKERKIIKKIGKLKLIYFNVIKEWWLPFDC